MTPANDYRLAASLFLKLLALIYFAAFASLAVQITGLAGHQGILPFTAKLEELRIHAGAAAYWKLPNIFWIESSDVALTGAALAGCLFSLLLLFNRVPRLSLALLFVLYLSLFHAGQIFLNFQWDYLLLEAGFLALLLTLNANHLVIWLFHWLLFRLRFESGISKLLSGDESWSNLTALRYYFETQPLPHWGAWYAHHLPDWMLRSGAGLVLFAELLIPLLLFLPRRFRMFAAGITLFTQLLILATSNHNWFNLLTIALCLFLFDDQALRRLVPKRQVSHFSEVPGPQPGRVARWAVGLSAATIMLVSTFLLWEMVSGQRLPERITPLVSQVRAYGITQRYHVFPTINRQRLEVELEGSQDGLNWVPYRFRHKPQDPAIRPAVVLPHQPRLDWMIWFVTLSLPMNARWLDGLVYGLFENTPEVTALLANNPFSDRPPRYVRANVYRYRFTTPRERSESGHWWVRESAGPLLPMPWVNPSGTISPYAPDASTHETPPPGRIPP